ncbi:hypothetical protein SELMODRAFT_271243 [Selaginella moellendorffii]|uniref:Thioredoxin-like fold domain-containing protein n=1 Tax=Selaginella moellendorffii TaxID=88036 RepID=D8S2K1_SELML|nr:uncharacterized protein LOC9639384 [Selaginella moellendorffii]EFJ21304.1 hypothetical protein SELMODRAFT_271243 [Selaginella moellendorffii]|eukprot:XP_002977300.1 uncharacterized protein LOC9639384 [Selaginella moellendorffii]
MAMAIIIRLLGITSALAIVAVCQFPIPRRYDGFAFGSYGGVQEPILVEAFFDPLCPDSKDSWPAIKQVAEEYGSEVKFIVHPFALPYHQQSFLSVRALHIANHLNASLTYPLLDLIFEHQEEFSNANTADKTASTVIDEFSSLFASQFGSGNEAKSIFKQGFYDSSTDQAGRISFKYGCSRGVTGTPVFFVNGVPLSNVDASWGIDEWANILDPLLATGPGMNAFG